MELVVFDRYRSACRALVLYGVLAGLLFSCGEGVRLFPFPVEKAVGTGSFGTDDGQRIQYEENAPRVEKGSEKKEDGSPDDGSDAQLALLNAGRSPILDRGILPAPADGISGPVVFYPLKFVSGLQGRAPPRA